MRIKGLRVAVHAAAAAALMAMPDIAMSQTPTGSSVAYVSEHAEPAGNVTKMAAYPLCDNCETHWAYNEHEHDGEFDDEHNWRANQQNHPWHEWIAYQCEIDHPPCVPELAAAAALIDDIAASTGDVVAISRVIQRASEEGIGTTLSSGGIALSAICRASNRPVRIVVPLAEALVSRLAPVQPKPTAS